MSAPGCVARVCKVGCVEVMLLAKCWACATFSLSHLYMSRSQIDPGWIGHVSAVLWDIGV